MPQTPWFFNQRELSLYNRLAGQRLSFPSIAAAATQPLGRRNHRPNVIQRRLPI